MSQRQTIILDFDGVIHAHTSGWQGATVIPDPPVEYAAYGVETLRTMGYRVVVYSSRCHYPGGVEAIRYWLTNWKIEVDEVVDTKVPASLLVDDRGYRFGGNWMRVLEFCVNPDKLRPWNKGGEGDKPRTFAEFGQAVARLQLVASKREADKLRELVRRAVPFLYDHNINSLAEEIEAEVGKVPDSYYQDRGS